MNLSQDELNALVKSRKPFDDVSEKEGMLTAEEIDILGEIGNISMGAVATTMYSLLDRRVEITTPRVRVFDVKDVLAIYNRPFVVATIEYIEGITGNNLLVLKIEDAALITDLLMGGEGVFEEPVELNEMHLSAISEIMNQMMGASSTSLSKLLNTSINISPPTSTKVDANFDVTTLLGNVEMVTKISFDMEIEGLLKSELIQLTPYEESRRFAKQFMDAGSVVEMPSYEKSNNAASPSPSSAASAGRLVDVHPMQFQAFDNPGTTGEQKGIDLVYNIPLQVTVELGKTKKEINEILKFNAGTVIMLDKVAGDPVEIVVNGKLIARGEVVVIDENYGVRITDIINL